MSDLVQVPTPDRRIPKTTANIDHMVVCSTGVFIIDAKRYRDARP